MLASESANSRRVTFEDSVTQPSAGPNLNSLQPGMVQIVPKGASVSPKEFSEDAPKEADQVTQQDLIDEQAGLTIIFTFDKLSATLGHAN